MGANGSPTPGPQIATLTDDRAVFAHADDDGVHLIELGRATGTIEYLDLGTDDVRADVEDEGLTIDRVDENIRSRTPVGTIKGAFQKQPGPVCESMAYRGENYKHRLEGVVVEFEQPPAQLPKLKLNLSLGYLDVAARENTRLNGLFVEQIGAKEGNKLLSALRGITSKTVSIGGYDIDESAEFGVTPMTYYGTAAGEVDSIDQMSKYGLAADRYHALSTTSLFNI